MLKVAKKWYSQLCLHTKSGNLCTFEVDPSRIVRHVFLSRSVKTGAKSVHIEVLGESWTGPNFE